MSYRMSIIIWYNIRMVITIVIYTMKTIKIIGNKIFIIVIN